MTAGCKMLLNALELSKGKHKQYIDLKRKQVGDVSAAKRSTRIDTGPFNSQIDCLFCGTNVHEGSAEYISVKTDNFARTVMQCCDMPK